MGAADRDQRRQDVLRRIEAMPLAPDQKQALREAALDLLRDSRVRGVAVFGSASQGKPNPSDLDLVVLVGGKQSWTRRRIYHEHSVHMQMRGVERFRHVNLERRQTRVERFPAFADLLSLWDETDSFAPARMKCRRLCARGPKPVSRWEAGRLRAELTGCIEQMEAMSADPATLALLAAQCLSRSIEIHLRLRGAWVPGQKEWFDALEVQDASLAARYRSTVARLGGPTECLVEMRALAAEALAPLGGLAGDYEVWYR